MALVHLRSCELLSPSPQPGFLLELRRMEELAALDRAGRHGLTDDPAAADLILFVESIYSESRCGPYLAGVRRDPVYRRYRAKSLVYHPHDYPVPLVPGIFPSLDRRWHWPTLARSGCYIVESNPFIREHLDRADGPDRIEPDLLASFVGCTSGQAVRRRLTAIASEDIRIDDTTAAFVAAVQRGDEAGVDRLKREFVATLARSRFVLCPRGYGASSIRLFEVMQMGRAPVILSDAWVPPAGPDWGTCSIRVRERDVHRLPALLRSRAAEAAELGRRARLAWEEWFSPERLFERLCDTGLDLLAARRTRPWVGPWMSYAHFVDPHHARNLLRRLQRA